MKAVSTLVATVFVIGIGLVATILAFTVVNPLVEKARDSGTVNEALQNMQLLDSVIKTVASEIKGAKKTVDLRIAEGNIKTDLGNETIYFEFEPRSRIDLDGFVGDIFIERDPFFLEYFNEYSNGDTASDAWNISNGSRVISNGKFLVTGGFAYKTLGKVKNFEFSTEIISSSSPDGQAFLVPGDPRDLRLFLPFDGNVNNSLNSTYDYSSYRNNATLINSVTWVDGKFGNATRINAANNSIEVNDDSSLDITDKISIEAWVNIP